MNTPESRIIRSLAALLQAKFLGELERRSEMNKSISARIVARELERIDDAIKSVVCDLKRDFDMIQVAQRRMDERAE